MFLTKKPSIGLTCGKFFPPHSGHEMMIDFAYRNCDFLYVIVTTWNEEPFMNNIQWLKDLAVLRGWERIRFVAQHDPFVFNTQKDENGTSTDESYWEWWLKDTRNKIGNHLDAVFTSDAYGERIAREFNAVWYPVDPNREMVDISATRIRANPLKHFKDIIVTARPSFCKTIAFVGAEAVGKTTMTKRISRDFGSSFAIEYGRTINEVRKELTLGDFQSIVDGQKSLIASAKSRSENGLVFTDTEEITTFLYMKHFDETAYAYSYERSRLLASIHPEIDLYVVLGINRPTVNDGSRFLDESQRWDLEKELIQILVDKELPYTIFYEADYEKRYDLVYNYIKKWVDNNAVA